MTPHVISQRKLENLPIGFLFTSYVSCCDVAQVWIYKSHFGWVMSSPPSELWNVVTSDKMIHIMKFIVHARGNFPLTRNVCGLTPQQFSTRSRWSCSASNKVHTGDLCFCCGPLRGPKNGNNWRLVNPFQLAVGSRGMEITGLTSVLKKFWPAFRLKLKRLHEFGSTAAK